MEEEVVLNRMVDRIESFFNRHKLVISAVVIFVVALGVFIYYKETHKSGTATLAWSDLGAYWSGRAPARLAGGKPRPPEDKDFLDTIDVAKGTSAEPYALITYADFLLDRGRFEEAERSFAEFLAQYPHHNGAPHAKVHRAYALEELRRFDKALKILEDVAENSDNRFWKEMANAQIPVLETARKMPAPRSAASQPAKEKPGVVKKPASAPVLKPAEAEGAPAPSAGKVE